MKFLVNWVVIGQSVVEASGPKEAEEQFRADRNDIVREGKDERHVDVVVHKA